MVPIGQIIITFFILGIALTFILGHFLSWKPRTKGFLLILVILISIMSGITAPMFTTWYETKNVYVYDKFEWGGFAAALGNGITYPVSYEAYGYLLTKTDATVQFKHDDFLGIVSINYVNSTNTTKSNSGEIICQVV